MSFQNPDRLSALIETLEAGDDLTVEQLQRTERLQVLDLAKAGQEFIRDQNARDLAQIELFRAM